MLDIDWLNKSSRSKSVQPLSHWTLLYASESLFFGRQRRLRRIDLSKVEENRFVLSLSQLVKSGLAPQTAVFELWLCNQGTGDLGMSSGPPTVAGFQPRVFEGEGGNCRLSTIRGRIWG